MKKTLMALSLALCATVAFAQMPKSARVDRAANEVTTKASTSLNVNEMQRQDAFKAQSSQKLLSLQRILPFNKETSE